MRRKGDRYSVQTSLIVAALRRLLPIGLNICAPGDQELIALAKNRFSMVSSLLAAGLRPCDLRAPRRPRALPVLICTQRLMKWFSAQAPGLRQCLPVIFGGCFYF